jgi:SP family general alpha glucoside:H+ symporter-like MFS transporter
MGCRKNSLLDEMLTNFTEAGMADDTAFAMGLATSALQWVMVMASWVLTTYLGRRTIYVYGQAINCVFLVALGIAASVGGTSLASKTAASNAQASLGLIVSVLFCLGPA